MPAPYACPAINITAGQNITLTELATLLQTATCLPPLTTNPNCTYPPEFFNSIIEQANGNLDYMNCTSTPLINTHLEALTNFFTDMCNASNDYNTVNYYINHITEYQVDIQFALLSQSLGNPCHGSPNTWTSNTPEFGFFKLTESCCSPNGPINSNTFDHLYYVNVNGTYGTNCQLGQYCLTFTKLPISPQPNPYTCENLFTKVIRE